MTGDTRGDDRIQGSLRTADGQGVVRLEGRFDTDIEDLWSALTEPGRLARWYGVVEGDLRLGGEYHAHVHASGWDGTGHVEVCDPPRRFATTGKDPEEPNEDYMEVTLTPDGDQTVLVVEHRRLPVDALWAYGAGDQIHVEDLADHVAGRERRDPQDRWAELEATYRALAADLS